MSLHKLTAGDGYTYLTRQVAAYDATDRGSNGLAEYYDETGESPGRWWGSGLIGLEMAAGSLVDEAQMKHLFGAGRVTSEYVDLKWAAAPARHRKGMAEALVNITFALIDTEQPRLSSFGRSELVTALTYGLFCRGLQREYSEDALKALQAAAPPAAVLSDPIVIRKLINAIGMRQDGRPAAEATIVRQRATLHNLLQFAVESRAIPANPLKSMKRTATAGSRRVDPRVVISKKQGKSLLKAVRVKSLGVV